MESVNSISVLRYFLTKSVEVKRNKFKRIMASKWFIRIRDIALFIVIIGGVMAWQSKDMLSTNGTVNIKQQNLVSLHGDVLPLLSDNKPNLLYFFAPWCQICSLSIGNLSYLNNEKVNVVVIALDYGSQEEVAKFVEEHGVTNTVLLGQRALKSQFAIQGYPSYYFLDKDHNIVSSSYGYSTAVGLKLREVFGH
jgi:thiol-disulfide isomerase/thioredoxin